MQPPVPQDSRVETYLQSQEEEHVGIWADIKGWTHTVGASLHRLVQQSMPTRYAQEDSEGEWVSITAHVSTLVCESRYVAYCHHAEKLHDPG